MNSWIFWMQKLIAIIPIGIYERMWLKDRIEVMMKSSWFHLEIHGTQKKILWFKLESIVNIGIWNDLIHDMEWREELQENNSKNEDYQKDKYKEFLIFQYFNLMNHFIYSKNILDISRYKKH